MRIRDLFFLGLLALSLVACKRTPAPDPQGFWLGTLQAGEFSLRLVLNVTKQDDGTVAKGGNTYHVTADSIDQGVLGIPVTSFVINNQNVTFELAGLGAAFRGEFKNQGQEMVGTWE